ncbi:hypothetical protein PF005_g21257 [Phytophthora fragariae]|uniref:Uncharacterized protein n=1 Tax=Phytophthora fragariae TaxID=53985 RepID=A0A6A3E297_9STRA|nr:hypothetical protein PF003_g22714 [Phytophthora fragariae]KAE8927675.1 hypothetical protein PF009_g22162 [Phytophthora fragariae]KAE8985969.1 hypothetical protein PF011_g20178 [Phytophthora fragariae]KAE9085422.1 hypothetical protein PF007_g21149 [Phytophthora fragariae]KAE9114337.1 hypothetical protein PF010_g9742 [Phytophthora fragariae]
MSNVSSTYSLSVMSLIVGGASCNGSHPTLSPDQSPRTSETRMAMLYVGGEIQCTHIYPVGMVRVGGLKPANSMKMELRSAPSVVATATLGSAYTSS